MDNVGKMDIHSNSLYSENYYKNKKRKLDFNTDCEHCTSCRDKRVILANTLSIKTCVLSAKKNRLNETVLLSTHIYVKIDG